MRAKATPVRTGYTIIAFRYILCNSNCGVPSDVADRVKPCLVAVEATGDHLTVTGVDSDVTGRDQNVSRSRSSDNSTKAEELGGSKVTGDDSDGCQRVLHHAGAVLIHPDLSIGSSEKSSALA
jgi:hypothetical protein